MKKRLPLWRVTTVLSAAALVGAGIAWVAILVAIGPPHGCMAMGAVIFLGATLLFLVFCAVAAALIAVGSFLSYRGSRFGPYLVALPNLAVMGFLGWWDPVAPGQLVWAWILVAMTCLPLVALLAVSVQLVSGGLSGHVAGAFAALLLAGLLVPWLAHGWALDLGYGYQVVQPVAAPRAPTPC